MAYPANSSSISFATINVEMGFSSNAQLSLAYAANQELGIVIGNQVKLCEFYSNGCVGVIPPTPTGFTVGDAVGLTYTLAWTGSVGATSYKIYRGGVYYKTVTGTSTTGDGVNYSTSYCWSVSAVNTNGESSQTSQICKTTQSGQTLYFVEYVYGTNATVACDYVTSEVNMFYVDAPYILDVTKIYTDSAGTIYAPTAYYSSAGDGVYIRWSNTGVVLSSGVCDNPI